MMKRFVFRATHRSWVGLAVVVVLLALHFGRADVVPMGRSFLHADWRWAAGAVALFSVSLLLRSAALKVIVDALGGVRARLRDTFSTTSIGLLANALVPVRVDVVLNPYVLFILLRRRRASVPFATVLGTTLTEQLFAIATFVALALLFVSTLSVPSWAVEVLIASAAFAATFLIGGIILERRRQRGRGSPAIGGDGAGEHEPAEGVRAAAAGRGHRRYLSELIDSQRIMGKPLSALLVVGIQTLAWLIQLAAAVVALEAFHLSAAGVRGAALVLVLTNLIGLVPITPGNLGTFQAAAVAALAAYGVAGGPGVAYSLGLQGMQLLVAVVAGLVSLSLQGLSLAELKAQGRQSASLLYRSEPVRHPRAEGPG